MTRLLAVLLLTCLSLGAATRVRDVVYDNSGRRASGRVVISWPTFNSAETGQLVPGGSMTVPITSGILDLQLEATPEGSSYTARFFFAVGQTRTEVWNVPVSSLPVAIALLRGDVPPSLPVTVLSGDASGPISATVVTRIQGLPVDAAAKSDGHALKWDEVAGLIRFGPVAADSGASTAAGDVAGPLADTRVERIQGVAVDASAPQDGQLMRYSGVTNRWTAVTLVDQETPGGAIDGVNVTFTLGAIPIPSQSLVLLRNGLVQKRCPGTPCDYDLTGNTITFASGVVPGEGDVLLASYRY